MHYANDCRSTGCAPEHWKKDFPQNVNKPTSFICPTGKREYHTVRARIPKIFEINLQNGGRR